MRRFGSKILSALLASALIVTPVMAAPSVDSLESEKAAAESEVESLQAKLTTTISKIDELEDDLVKKGEEIIQATDDLDAAEKKEEQQYQDMKLRIKYMYEEGDTSAIEAIFTSTDFSDLINKAEYVQNVHEYDRDKLDEYVETVHEVETLKGTLETEQTELEEKETEFKSQQDELNTMISGKESEIAQLDSEIQEAVLEAARKAAAEEAAAQKAAEEEEAPAETNNTQTNDTEDESEDTKTEETETESQSQSSSDTESSYSGDSSKASTIVNTAYSMLGVPYVWGGSSPSGFDCSGLVMYCHAKAGISLPHSSGSIGGGGKDVSSPQAGDVICWSGHVGIYVGGDSFIEAPQTGEVVKVSSVSHRGGGWYRRYW